MTTLSALCIGAYLIGSIPTAYLMGRLLKGIDIREHGSGNVGATNVMRVLGTPAGIATLAIDLLKGYVAVRCLVPVLRPDGGDLQVWNIAACIAVVAGHNWMLFLRFTGGKGVATTAGAFLAMMPCVILSAFVIFAATVALTRYVSLGSILAGISIPVFVWFYYDRPGVYLWFSVALTAALVLKHRANIARLVAGTEKKLGSRTERVDR
ncbi:MAG TPA: glycerol-3-phosphate 1-O-acyltransferase PlsY [bacterium]|nr:glycerol-3-phosphate 1-O-acyltransferase PlsY [bacterium]